MQQIMQEGEVVNDDVEIGTNVETDPFRQSQNAAPSNVKIACVEKQVKKKISLFF